MLWSVELAKPQMLESVLGQPHFRTPRDRARVRVRVGLLHKFDFRSDAWSSQEMRNLIVKPLPNLDRLAPICQQLRVRKRRKVLRHLDDILRPQLLQPRIVIPELRHHSRRVSSSPGIHKVRRQPTQGIAFARAFESFPLHAPRREGIVPRRLAPHWPLNVSPRVALLCRDLKTLIEEIDAPFAVGEIRP